MPRRDEIGARDCSEYQLAEDIRQLLVLIRFDSPGPIPTLATEHQTVPMIPACSKRDDE